MYQNSWKGVILIANDVKWIKMMVGMFDGMSFKKIKRAKIGGESFRDKLTAVWFELMDFAGKCNHNGAFVGTNEIPFTDLSDIAVMLDRDDEELELCMAFYIKEGMVTITDDVYSLTNWAEYQNKEGLDKIREQTRLRVAKHRENQKLLVCNVTSNATVTQGNALDKDKEEDKDKEKENNIYSPVVEYLNQLAGTSYKASSKKTQGLIRARVAEGFKLDDFKKVIDKKSSEWLGTDMEKYLRPETLFGTKFESYLNANVRKGVSNDITSRPADTITDRVGTWL